eukprot:1175339-Prorocentrum_minimum.AAC.1
MFGAQLAGSDVDKMRWLSGRARECFDWLGLDFPWLQVAISPLLHLPQTATPYWSIVASLFEPNGVYSPSNGVYSPSNGVWFRRRFVATMKLGQKAQCVSSSGLDLPWLQAPGAETSSHGQSAAVSDGFAVKGGGFTAAGGGFADGGVRAMSVVDIEHSLCYFWR